MYVDSFSLLWPGNEEDYSQKTRTLTSATTDNLNLDGLSKSIAGNMDIAAGIKEILCRMCFDGEVISYRQEIFNDIASSDELMNSVEKILEQLQHLKYLQKESMVPEDINLWKFFARFKELDGYIDCITIIAGALRGVGLKSAGMKRLRDTSIRISEDEEFKKLSGMVKNLGVEINEIQSITLGINLDSSMDPVEAMNLNEQNEVFEFVEKPKGDGSWINAGFFVMEPEIFKYLEDDTTILEKEPLQNLAKDGELVAYRHNSFWQPMDTLRDKNYLESLWQSGRAPWRVWRADSE